MTSFSIGFFGKIPSRGDFVRGGLPTDFVQALDQWWQTVLPASRSILGNATWTECWMEAPIWQFTLPPGFCGAHPAAGLWLPSTDRVGRLFPLTLVLVATGQALMLPEGIFDVMRSVGLEAVEHDITPEQIHHALSRALQLPANPLNLSDQSIWQTEGNRLVAPASRQFKSMPDGTAFAAMLRDPDLEMPQG